MDFKKSLMFIFLLTCSSFFTYFSLYAQTADTTKTDVSQTNRQDSTRIKLPDVVIYGKDRSVRQYGHKLATSGKKGEKIKLEKESSILPRDEVLYQKLRYSLAKENQTSRKLIRLGYGRFQELNFGAGIWQEFSTTNIVFQGGFSRSNGQYENSQYRKADAQAQISQDLSENFITKADAKFIINNYGLHGAKIEQLTRSLQQSRLYWDNHWTINKSQTIKLAFQLFQSGLNTENLPAKSKVEDNRFGLTGAYSVQVKNLSLNLTSYFSHYNFENKPQNLTQSQNYFSIRSEFQYPFRDLFSLKAGFVFQDIEIDQAFSKNRFSPNFEFVFTPMQNIGFKLSGAQGYQLVCFFERLELNPYLDGQIDFRPDNTAINLAFNFEYQPIAFLTLKTSINWQKIKQYSFWERDSLSGLFQLHRASEADLSYWDCSVDFKFNKHLTLNVELALGFESIQDDTLETYDDKLPYFPKYKMPVTLKYEPGKNTLALLDFQLVGPRRVSVYRDESLEKYWLISVRVQQKVTSYFSFFLNSHNLLNQEFERWQGYRAMGFYVESGMKFQW